MGDFKNMETPTTTYDIMKKVMERKYIRTEIEIAEAVALLEKNKSECVEKDYFGGNNIAKSDVRIDTIKNQRSEEYIYQTYPSVDENDKEDSRLHSLWQSGITALEYLRGEIPIEYLLVPLKQI